MATVTTSNLSKLVIAYYDKLMLETLHESIHVYHDFGEKKPLPKAMPKG